MEGRVTRLGDRSETAWESHFLREFRGFRAVRRLSCSPLPCFQFATIRWVDTIRAAALHAETIAMMTESGEGVEAERKGEERTQNARTGTEATVRTVTGRSAHINLFLPFKCIDL